MTAEKTVMVVEDDPEIRESIEDVLVGEGYRVITAENGKVGLERLRAHENEKPCVILVDLMMPVMSGDEFVTRLRKESEGGDVPVVIVSALPEDASELGDLAQAYVKKPIALDDLLDAVGTFCCS